MLSWFRRLRGAFRRRKPWLRSLPLRLERLEDRDVPSGLITEFSTPTAASGLWDIAPGSDGALWFTEQGPFKIGRVTTSGTLTEYPLSSPFVAPTAITAGSDGALWFTDAKTVGRITTGGAVTAFPISGVDRQLVDIVAGPDGALWFTEQNSTGDAIGRLTTSGSYTRYAVSSVRDGLWGITVGPDGALWFTEGNIDKIGRLTISGVLTEYSIPTANSVPLGITEGPDGALWFVESAANRIGRLTISGVFTEYSIPTAFSVPLDIVTGSDGALWFTDSAANRLGRLTTSGVFKEYSIPTANSFPAGLVAVPGGSIWFTESNANRVGRFLDVPPSAAGVSINATEGQVSSGLAATFTDGDPNATASDFSATISWGDGNTGIGTIAANGSGGFNVSGTNTYAEEGSDTVSVTITDYLGDSSTATSTATVVDASLTAAGQPISTVEGTAFGGPVATFTDASSLATTGDFTAMISWGDGHTSSGTIAENAGAFTVSGSNAYAGAGAYTVQVSIQDGGGSSAATTNAATITDASLSASGRSASAAEGSAFSGVVATFTDGNPLSTPAGFSATVAWGDGQTSTGNISEAAGVFSVSAGHAWAEAGSYTIQVSVQDTEGSSASASASATVSDAALSASGQPFSMQEGTGFNGVVAAFTDANALATTADLTATITWGDGQTATGTITQNAGVFSVSATHTYAEAGSYTVQIAIQDAQGSSASTTATATVSDATLTAAGQAVSMQEGTGFSGLLATFTDANPLPTAGDFSATVTWGDGQTSTATISLSGGTFSVSASHTWAEAGSYTIQVSILDAQGSSASTSAAATISDAALSGASQSFNVQEGTAYSGVLGNFTDGNPLSTTADFNATITWGDGQTSVGSISQNAGVYRVSASHAYAEAGSYTVQISIHDVEGSTATPTASATISDAALTASAHSFSAQEGTTYSGALATFTDGNALATATDFSATVTWGDGQTSTASVSLGAGTFSVTASHTYAETGSYAVQVSIHDAQGSNASASATATISDAPLTATGQTFSVQEGSAFNGVVASFTDANALATTADFSAVVTWGDGQTSTSTITQNAGVFSVSASHTYAEAGSYAVQISIRDLDGSSASASTTGTVSDAALTATGQAVSIQEGSGFNGVVATFTDANPLATAADVSATVTWGDGQTSTATIGLSGGTFRVSASHTWKEAGSYTIQVSILDAQGSSASTSATATISDAALSAVSQSFSVQEGTSYSGVVAGFTDGNPLTTTADFSATITWGDGQTSVGSISQNAGVYSVSASHAYAEAGSYTFQVSIQDAQGNRATAGAAATISDASLNASGHSFGVQEGSSYSGIVAAFADANPLAGPADFSATVAWGDGQTSTGTISLSAGVFSVSATRTYAKAGSYRVQVSIYDAEGSTTSTSATATISDARLSAAGHSFSVQEGTSYSAVITTFADGNPLSTAGDFSANVAWGDGQTTVASITENAGVFSVSASHAYAEAGSYTVQISVRDAQGSGSLATAAASISDAPLSASGRPFGAQEGALFSGTVATFTDAKPLASTADFNATISWGDGQTSTGVVSASGGVFTVTGAHTFAHAGSYTAQVAIEDVGGSTATAIAGAMISDAPLKASGQPISLQEDSVFSGVVANFTDANALAAAGDFIATIAWGDGQTAAGSIAMSRGLFTVSGSHSYAIAGSYVVTVTVVDHGGASAVSEAAATIAPASIIASAEPVSGVAGSSFMGLVATFTPVNLVGSASNYSAVISWGDGSTTNGIVIADPSGGFNVSSAHTYAEPGRKPLTVTIRGPGSAAVTVTGTAVVAPAGSLQVSAGTVTATNSIPYSGVVATFSDPVPGAQPSDYVAVISWGDGSTSAGIIVPDGHGGYDVTGSYQYSIPGSYPIQITIRDRSGTSSVVTTNARVAQFNEIPPTAPTLSSALVTTNLAEPNPPGNPTTTIVVDSPSRAASSSNSPAVVNVDSSAAAASSKAAASHVPPPRPSQKAARPPGSAGPATPTADPPRRAAGGFDQHTSVLSNKLLVAELDAMGMGMQARAIRVQDVAIGVGLVASAGYVVWALRNSYFLTSLLAATPLWRQFDPLAVLDLWEGKRPRWFAADDDDEDESLESLVERNARRLAAQPEPERKSP